tara:strand:- start:181 stop:468 length:288 start_codon:yes stop_codon:yes gene_type:complete
MSLRRGVRFVLHGRGRGGGGDTNVVLNVFISNVFLSKKKQRKEKKNLMRILGFGFLSNFFLGKKFSFFVFPSKNKNKTQKKKKKNAFYVVVLLLL